MCVWGGGGDGGGGIRALKLLVMLNWSNTILMVFFSYSYESEKHKAIFSSINVEPEIASQSTEYPTCQLRYDAKRLSDLMATSRSTEFSGWRAEKKARTTRLFP